MFKTIGCLLLLSTFVMAQSNTAQPGEPIRQTLTSTVRNLRIETWQMNSSQMPFKSAGAWSIQKYVLHGGK